MPILFSAIPDHINNSIAQKQDIQDFAKFHECSRASSQFVQKMKYKVITDSWSINKPLSNDGALLVYNNPSNKINLELCIMHRTKRLKIPLDSANELPIQIMGNIVYICVLLTEELCNWLMGFIKKTKSTLNGLHVQKLNCTQESLNALIEMSKIDKFSACASHHVKIAWKYLTVPAMKNLQHLHTYLCSIDDFQLKTLKMPYLDIYESNISSVGINLLLKEWLNYERKIAMIKVAFKQPVEEAAIFNGIPYCVAKADKTNTKMYLVKNGRGDEIHVTVDVTCSYLGDTFVVIQPPNSTSQ